MTDFKLHSTIDKQLLKDISDKYSNKYAQKKERLKDLFKNNEKILF